MKNKLTRRGLARRALLRGTAGTVVSASAANFIPVDTAMGGGLASCPSVPTPMKDVRGKVAFITGGSSGIGLGIARALVDAGMKVVVSYRSREHLKEAMSYLEDARERVHAVELDVTNRGGVEAAAAEAIRAFGKVHVLVNNAGVYALGPASEATYTDWDWMMNVNLTGVFNCISTFLPHIRAHGEGGQIVTTASAWGLYAVENAAIYCASKAAVIMMMEVLRCELLPMNIGASVYCPGVVFSRGWNSARNRPDAPVDINASADATKVAETEASNRRLRDSGALMDPLEAGRIVLEGIRNNYLHILSHPEYGEIIRQRGEALQASIPADVQVPEERIAIERPTLSNSTYEVERQRRRCLSRTSAQRKAAG